jgi:hypothetical protein
MSGRALGSGLILALAFCAATAASPSGEKGSVEERFATSLHATRPGKDHWYGKKLGGFENWTGVGIDKLGCTACHGPKDADGNAYPDPYPGAGCVDCHASEDQVVSVDQCLGCHGRQKTERRLTAEAPDVHIAADMTCWNCHGDEDMHGDGVAYASMLEPGAIDADCEDCHELSQLPAKHASYDPHKGKLHCTACHTATVVSCYNCHFESQVEAHVKRANRPLHDFVMLVNREKDGKVHPATFQSLTYKGDAFVAFAPYTAHTITKKGRDCKQCHVNKPVRGENEAITQYNESGVIRFTRWNEGKREIEWIRGVVPIPEDYETSFKMEFITFEGDPATPAGQDGSNWTAIGKDTWDGHQMMFATPLTRKQMKKLGFKKK